MLEVQLFWESHKNLRNLPHGLDIYIVNIQTMRKIAQIFVAFSENLNFAAKKVVGVHSDSGHLSPTSIIPAVEYVQF